MSPLIWSYQVGVNSAESLLDHLEVRTGWLRQALVASLGFVIGTVALGSVLAVAAGLLVILRGVHDWTH